MIEINRHPSRRDLAWFGGLLTPFAGVLGGLLWWRFGWSTAAVVIWSIGAGVTLLFWGVPPLRRPIYVGWVTITFPIGWVLSHAVLGIIYYLVLTPTGLIMRLLGRDPMARRIDPGAPTYWSDAHPPHEPGRYFRQF